MEIGSTDALTLVDVQNDFAPGGALPVNDAGRASPPTRCPPFDNLLARIPIRTTACRHSGQRETLGIQRSFYVLEATWTIRRCE